MSSQRPPLGYHDVIQGLGKLGFSPRPRKATSHEQWTRVGDGRLFKVTVDKSKSPFGHFLVKSMARQAGISVPDFYKACGKG